jgi:hypothetical protein
LAERKFRRVITGHNEEGKSIVAYDGPPMGETGMWNTNKSPADNTVKIESVVSMPKLEPPQYGSKFGYFQLPPDDPSKSTEELEKEWAAGFAAIESSHCRPDTSRDPRQ